MWTKVYVNLLNPGLHPSKTQSENLKQLQQLLSLLQEHLDHYSMSWRQVSCIKKFLLIHKLISSSLENRRKFSFGSSTQTKYFETIISLIGYFIFFVSLSSSKKRAYDQKFVLRNLFRPHRKFLNNFHSCP
jgi:hypothetical protein